MNFRHLLSGLLLSAFALTAEAQIRVFACEPEWGALVNELAGDAVTVDVATSALQDVHQIEARPSLIAKLRRADLLVCSGGGLEAGWLPQLIRQAGNARVASGDGMFLAVAQVTTLERPSQLDRAAGDLHAEGNPHIQMDPRRVLQVANALAARLQKVDAANATRYAQRLEDFSTRWQAAMLRWQQRAAPLRGRNIVVHHKSWVYLEEWLGLNEIGALEAKPGVPPTSAHLSGLVALTKDSQTLAIVRAAYQDAKASRWLSERSGVPAIRLPLTVGGDERATDLFALFDVTIDLLLGAAQ